MGKIKERIVEYLKINNITKQDFCEKTGISYANMVGKSLESEFGGEQISQIIMKFPNLSPDWLLLGKGEMLRAKTSEMTPSSQEDVKMLQKNINNLNQLIDHLNERIEALEEALDVEKKKVASYLGETNTEIIWPQRCICEEESEYNPKPV